LTENKKSAIRTIAVVLLLLFILTAGYLAMLEAVVPHSGLRFLPGWEDHTFSTASNESLVWSDTNFEEGWRAAWLYNQYGSPGFEGSNGTLVLGATFNGLNKNDVNGVSGIIVKKDIPKLNTITSPFLIIKHMESSSNPALMFSFGIIDGMGFLHAGDSYRVSTSLTTLNIDLRTLYNGTIRSILIVFTNYFNPDSMLGMQFAYIKLIAIYREQPDWWLATTPLTPATISNQQGILKLSGNGNLSEGTIISAQRSKNLTFNLVPFNYINVSIMTSSLDIAARIVIWPTNSSGSISREVLLKTYNDNQWHTEIVELSLFGLTKNIYRIELGLITLDSSTTEEWICYKDLSFNMWQVSDS
jgi:hypothetical protein